MLRSVTTLVRSAPEHDGPWAAEDRASSFSQPHMTVIAAARLWWLKIRQF